jgi:hypothetical protein
MKSTVPFDKIQLIRGSLRCFAFGIVGVLPGIGLPFAIVALGEVFRINRHKGSTWNPAERYLTVGALLASLGLGLTLLLFGIVLVEIS